MPVSTDQEAAFTRCRTIGHAWFEADSDWNTTMGTPWTLRCERCMTERREVISHTGRLVQRHYVYPDGYQNHWDSDMNKEAFRVLMLKLRLQEARQDKARRAGAGVAKRRRAAS